MFLAKEGIKPMEEEVDSRPMVDDLSPRPSRGNCQFKNNQFLFHIRPMRVIAKYFQVEKLEHYHVIKPKNFKEREEEERDDEEEDYENEEDRPGYESEPEAIEAEDDAD